MLAIGLLQAADMLGRADRLVMAAVARLRSMPGADLLTSVANIIDVIGDAGARLVIIAIIGAALALGGRQRTALWFVVAAGASMIFNPLLKLLFAASRPEVIEPLAAATGYSFPSGHTTGAMTLYGAIALIFRTRIALLLCMLMIFATGTSRVWLGVHWSSDVIGGWCAGLAWLMLMSLCPPIANEANQENGKSESGTV